MIALDSEVVSSRYDSKTRTCFYTIFREGKRWTVAIPLEHLDAHKANKQARRNHVGNRLTIAMRNPPDPPTGSKADPFKPATWQDFDNVPKGAWYINPADGVLAQKDA